MTTGAPIRIRKATEADVEAIAEINLLAWQVAWRGLLPDERRDAMRLDERIELFQERLASADDARERFLVASRGDTVGGFAGFSPARDDHEDATSTAEVTWLFVHPDHWRHGVGQRLLDAAVGAMPADGFLDAMLWTLTDSRQSRGFYEAMGWQGDGGTQVWKGIPMVRYRLRLPAADATTPGD